MPRNKLYRAVTLLPHHPLAVAWLTRRRDSPLLSTRGEEGVGGGEALTQPISLFPWIGLTCVNLRLSSPDAFRSCHSERVDEVIRRTDPGQRRISCTANGRFFAGPVARTYQLGQKPAWSSPSLAACPASKRPLCEQNDSAAKVPGSEFASIYDSNWQIQNGCLLVCYSATHACLTKIING